MKRLGSLAVAVAMSLALAGAAAAQPAQSQRDDVIMVQDTDPEMQRAIAEARAELPAFFQRLAAPGADEGNFSVKFDLAGTAEMIWAGELRRENGRLTGTLSNVPMLEGYRQGQRVVIPETAIIDWSYQRGRRIVGHRTTRVLLDRMPPERAAGIREALGW